jgi:hypothetical protein
VTVAYPLMPAALAAERIADLHRAAARRRIVLAALRLRRRRPAVASDPRPSTQTVAPGEQPREHLCDAMALVGDAKPNARPERSDLG